MTKWYMALVCRSLGATRHGLESLQRQTFGLPWATKRKPILVNLGAHVKPCIACRRFFTARVYRAVVASTTHAEKGPKGSQPYPLWSWNLRPRSGLWYPAGGSQGSRIGKNSSWNVRDITSWWRARLNPWTTPLNLEHFYDYGLILKGNVKLNANIKVKY